MPEIRSCCPTQTLFFQFFITRSCLALESRRLVSAAATMSLAGSFVPTLSLNITVSRAVTFMTLHDTFIHLLTFMTLSFISCLCRLAVAVVRLRRQKQILVLVLVFVLVLVLLDKDGRYLGKTFKAIISSFK